MTNPLQHVAIIGAGIGGCALALILSSRDIAVTIHESRPADAESYMSGVILTPNGLRILDQLGVLPRIQSRCYRLTQSIFKNDRDETTKQVSTADPKVHGYSNHRLWRQILLDEMKLMLSERGVSIAYSSHFTNLNPCTASCVSYSTTNLLHPAEGPCTHSCTLLVAADGAHSTLRSTHVAPSIQPVYTGTMGIATHLRRSSIPLPDSAYPSSQATIQGTSAALIFLAEDPSLDPMLFVGVQITHSLDSRAEVAALQRDKDALAAFFRQGYDSWAEGSTARRIVDEVCRAENRERLFVWAYERMPPLERWFEAKTGRIVLLGDAAHVLPPSSGQGASQALEDAASLVEVLQAVSKGGGEGDREEEEVTQTLLEGLRFWQEMRQKRVEEISEWTTNSQNVDRLPKEQREKARAAMKEGSIIGANMNWLYKPDWEEQVKRWIDEQGW